MNYRVLGKTGYSISQVSLGTWQIGGRWGDDFNEKSAVEILNRAIDLGVNFIDTADVYSNGLSEKVVGQVVKSRSERIYVATKCGRALNPHNAEGYNKENIRRFVERSLKNTGLEALDLIQLHCPPSEVYYKDEVFQVLNDLKKEGKVLNYGVSVEKVEEALNVLKYPEVATVQIIFNMFRQKPIEQFFEEAKKNDIGIIARVPLASGLLTGNMTKDTVFGANDHRTYNRKGEAFDKGETFSGVDYEKGVEAAKELKKLFPNTEKLSAYALRWVLMFDAVSTVIPGASRVEQAESNIAVSDLPSLSDEQIKGVKEIYEKYIKADVHHLW
jgi:aryl-alcohol dehydrogenase-like predicted oxidoreductase